MLKRGRVKYIGKGGLKAMRTGREQRGKSEMRFRVLTTEAPKSDEGKEKERRGKRGASHAQNEGTLTLTLQNN